MAMMLLDADDAATEVQTNFDSSQNFAMIVKFVILNTTKPVQIWYTPSNVGVVGIHRYEYQRNYIKI